MRDPNHRGISVVSNHRMAVSSLQVDEPNVKDSVDGVLQAATKNDIQDAYLH